MNEKERQFLRSLKINHVSVNKYTNQFFLSGEVGEAFHISKTRGNLDDLGAFFIDFQNMLREMLSRLHESV